MDRQPISIEKFAVRPYAFFDTDWLLLTCGDFAEKKFNAMTISWGSLGVMWNRPFVQVVVRPVRYTYEFIEAYETFTLCAFPRQYHAALSLLGTRSGRDGDKIAEAGLTPTSACRVAAPAYAEAQTVIECRKMYWQDIDPAHFLDPKLDRNYPEKDYHRIYFGEILAVEVAVQEVPAAQEVAALEVAAAQEVAALEVAAAQEVARQEVAKVVKDIQAK